MTRQHADKPERITPKQYRENVLAALAEIVMRLRMLTTEPGQDDGPPACEHPPEARLDFSTSREDHWQCRACGYEYRR
jgi:hypothetical protein